jgi:predicted transcriptional regulator
MPKQVNAQNPNRTRAKLIISLVPGIHLRRLQKLLGASFSTTRHHVEALEQRQEIVSSDDGRYHRLYPAGMDDGLKAVYTSIQSETARRVLRALAGARGGLTNGDISQIVHLPRSTVSEYTSILCDARLVSRSTTIDSQVLYSIEERGGILQLMDSFEKNLLAVATDRFLDLWDF